MRKQIQHQAAACLLPYTPLLRLILRLLLLAAGIGVLLIVIFSVSNYGGRDVLWNPFLITDKPSKLGQTYKRTMEDPHDDEEEGEILNKDPTYPRIRDWLWDHIYFSFYDGTKVYTNKDDIKGSVSRRLHAGEISFFSQIHDRTLKYLNSRYNARYTPDHCTSTRYRDIPSLGVEVDVTCSAGDGNGIHRVSLLWPVQRPRVVYHHFVPSATMLNIIMPLRGRPHNLKIFLENLSNILQKGDLHLGLTVVYFEDGHQQKAHDLIEETDRRFSNLKTDFILLEESVEFSRGRGLQEGVERTSIKAPVVFFCDVDVLFKHDFLMRCQATPIEGHQVFIPVVFSLYNPDFVYGLKSQKVQKPLEQLHVLDNHGYWRLWGHGMVCIYKSDIQKIGGFDTTNSGWGGEDLKFVRRTVRNGNYKIIRSLDPDLFHRYHPKECSRSGKGKYFACLKAKAANEASKMSFGFWYLKQKQNMSVYGVLADGNQPHNYDYSDDDSLGFEDEAKRNIQTQLLLSEYKTLLEVLLAVVLISILLLDMFLMFRHYRKERKFT